MIVVFLDSNKIDDVVDGWKWEEEVKG